MSVVGGTVGEPENGDSETRRGTRTRISKKKGFAIEGAKQFVVAADRPSLDTREPSVDGHIRGYS